ncbi:hypothetical protein [Actinomadura sp. WMMA1423]|uniref:hypothetical protein n=1 Tax=Actinomadura sp. WMMA1423 TaxID=2591108 RepID=UPI001146726C|nr:hypothetical protein [Actinomadura sp. WMMA1423]
MDNPPGPGKGPETTDKPTPPESGGTSSHDHPGADGKTPRVDSLSAAGWKFPGRPETGTGQPGDRDPKTNDSTAVPTRDNPQTQGAPAEIKPDARRDPESDKTDSALPPTDPEDDETDSAQTGEGGSEAEKPGHAEPEEPRQDQGERGNDDQEAEAGQSETGKVDAQGDHENREPRPQDAGSSTGGKTDDPQPTPQPVSRLESIARAREAQHEYAEQLRAKSQDSQPSDDTAQQPLGEEGDQNAPPQNAKTGEREHGQEVQPPVNDETPPGGADDNDSDNSGGDSNGKDDSPPEEQTHVESRSGERPVSRETKAVTEEQQQSFEQSQRHLDGLSKKGQSEEVGKGFERDGQRYKPEAALLKAAKHGVDWSEGRARAIREGRPQGQFGSAADVQYATERGAELGPNKTGFFRLPEGHDCVEYHPDGETSTPDSLFVKVYPNGKVHAYPLTR